MKTFHKTRPGTEQSPRTLQHRGFSLLEVLAVITILAVLSMMAISRFISVSANTKKNTCYMNKEKIAIQAQLWYRSKGNWPAENMSEMASDTEYFPEGLPVCPVDGTVYRLDAQTHEVIGHVH